MGKIRILVIDDSSTIRNTLRLTLEFKGYDVDEAADGRQGLDRINEQDYHLVFCDLAMPVMDGMTFIQEVRTNLDKPDLPIIVLSAEEEAAKNKAVDAGATSYIGKPFSPQQILAIVERTLGPDA